MLRQEFNHLGTPHDDRLHIDQAKIVQKMDDIQKAYFRLIETVEHSKPAELQNVLKNSEVFRTVINRALKNLVQDAITALHEPKQA